VIGSLFSGIGLLDLGLERAGLGSPAWQVEIDPWCRKVLARHWPSAERFDDVRAFAPPSADVRVVCGGFPCQPHSVAGKRLGAADERHLWPDYARIIREAAPAVVIIENVPGLRTTELRGVLADLAELGFDAEWTTFSAGSLGAPHRRSRIWIAATHPDRASVRGEPGWLARAVGTAQQAQSRHDREVLDPDAAGIGPQGADRIEAERRTEALQPRKELAPHADGIGRVEHAIRVATQRGWARHCGWQLDPSPRVDDGSTRELDVGRRKKALGNGVVVACAELVGRAVKEACSWT
jgi:DNA (cytosine-5)-methyltransferase 1